RLAGKVIVPGWILGRREGRERPRERSFEVAAVGLEIGLEVVRWVCPDVGAVETKFAGRAVEADIDANHGVAFDNLRYRFIESRCAPRLRRQQAPERVVHPGIADHQRTGELFSRG